MRGTHLCACGQRFKLPSAGRFNVLAEEDTTTLFYLPATSALVAFDELRSAASARNVDIESAGIAQLPLAWLETGREA